MLEQVVNNPISSKACDIRKNTCQDHQYKRLYTKQFYIIQQSTSMNQHFSFGTFTFLSEASI